MKIRSERSPVGPKRASAFGVGLAAAVLGLASADEARAQFNTAFPVRTYPTLPYTTPENKDYNLKLGPLTVALDARLRAEWSDNINLAQDDERDDLFIEPRMRFGFLYAPARNHSLNFDISVGYRFYLDNTDLNTFDVSPNSALEYRLLVDDFQFRIYDRFGVDLDATSNPEFSEGDSDDPANNDLLEFRRFSNTIGLDATWQPTARFTTTAGYSYYLNRTISGTLERLDRDDHNFSLNASYEINNQWSAGAHGSFTTIDYLDNDIVNGQNDGYYYTVGPLVTFRPNQKLTFSGSFGYTMADYDENGMNGDTDDFQGMTWQVGVRHQMARNTSQDLRVGLSADPGVNSNYSEILRVQYGISTEISRGVVLSGGLGYDHLEASSAIGEEADRFLATLNTSFQITRQLNASLGYTFATKDSDVDGRDYLQNRVTGVFVYSF